MTRHIWKYGWFWGVVGSILVVAVPPLIWALFSVDRDGRQDGGGIRVNAFGFFFATNNVTVQQSSTTTSDSSIVIHNAPPAPAKAPAPAKQDE